MTVAFDELHADRAPSADGVTKDEYAVGLQERLHEVVGLLHGRAYHPLPSRRQMIPKANGKLRPLGMGVILMLRSERG